MRLSQICIAIAQLGRGGAWSPLALWPDGIDTPGMWISPRDLTSQWQDSAGTTPVATPGTVADSANPVGLALDIRAGATVLTDPGNHMLQSTSVDRPLLSARVNLLTYTEDFTNEAWTNTNVTLGSLVAAPDGSITAQRLTITAAFYGPIEVVTFSAGIGFLRTRCYVRSVSGNTSLYMTVASNVGALVLNPFTATPTWQEFTFSSAIDPAATSALCYFVQDRNGSGQPTVIEVWHPQVSLGSGTPAYQQVNTASDYDSTGFPIAQKYNGTNSSMATAAFSAGTLIDGMDCMIAVRRDSNKEFVILSGGGNYLGFVNDYAGNATVLGSGAAVTVWVDGAQVAGGVVVTAAALGAALTLGDWHIVEFRNADLSGWVAVASMYLMSAPGYVANGPRGDILLFPSTASTEDKDAARQYLADYYGVTLP
jgi:hypothetical protein